MSTFTWNPRYSAQSENTPRVRKAEFGDGYSQRVGQGINNLKRVWSLSFKLDIADMDAIEAFFIAADGVETFDWVPPSGAAGIWICPSWTRTSDDGYDQISAKFEEQFGD